MKKITNRFRALMLIGAIGSMLFTSIADARLIFSTEDTGGVDSSTYTLNQDAAAEDVTLSFGSDLGNTLQWDESEQTFVFSQPLSITGGLDLTGILDMGGYQIQNFLVHNSSAVPATCDGSAAGQMYYDTDTNDLWYCNGTAWTDLASGSVSPGSITETELNASVAGAGITGGAGTPLAINVDDSTVEIATDTLRVKDDGITAAKLAFDTAGDGLVQNGTTGALDVSAGNGITLSGDSVTINADSTTGATVAPVSVTANGVGVTVDNSTIDHTTGEIGIKDAGVTATQLATSVAGNGLTGGAGTALAVGDGSGITVSADAIAANVDDSTVEINGSDQIAVKAGGITFTEHAEREVSITLTPEFQNFTLSADGADNTGTMYSDYDSTAKRNYYRWETKNTTTAQDYDVVIQWAIPENFQGFSSTDNEIEIDYKTDTTTATDNKLDVTLLDTAGTSVTLTGGTGLVSSTADTWVDDSAITFTGGTFTPGDYITLGVKMTSKASGGADLNPVYLGAVKFNIRVK